MMQDDVYKEVFGDVVRKERRISGDITKCIHQLSEDHAFLPLGEV